MTIETFLSRLHKVKKRGHGQWMACCPAHDDRTPSMTIKDDNGKILMKCWGQGCSVFDICAAIGMEVHELFPPSDHVDYERKPYRSYFPADQVLEALSTETLIVHMISKDMLTNSIDQETRERLILAVERIHAASNYIRPK